MEGLKQPPPRRRLLVYLVAAVVLVALVGAFRWFYQSSTSTESHRWSEARRGGLSRTAHQSAGRR
ncbi:MAG: hypothetical protein U0736_12840 [Gemmataceae bacterium]